MYFNLVKAVILVALAGSVAIADNFSFTGSLAADDSVQLFSFTLATTSTTTLQTYSYAGGLNHSGVIVSRGGFDPILSLFNSAGVLIDENDDGYGNVSADSVTGQHWDSYVQTTLAAGTYTVALTQYDNFPNGPNLGDGFSRTGQPQFTSLFGCSNGGFCDRTGDSRTANWEFDVSNTASAASVPEPGGAAPIAAGMMLIGVWCGLQIRSRASEKI